MRIRTPARAHVVVWLATALLTAGVPAAGQNLLNNGDFETGNATGWSVVGSQTFVVGGLGVGGTFGMISQQIGVNDRLSQSVGTIPGASYAISYALRNNLAGSSFFQSSFAGQTLQSLNSPAAFGFTTFNFTTTATDATSELLFVIRHDPSFYVLDNISVMLLSMPSLIGPGAPFNIAQVAGGLSSAFGQNMAASAPYLGLYTLDPATRRQVLGTMTGEVSTGIQTATLLVSGQFLDTMGAAARGGWGGCEEPSRRWASWATLNGTSGRLGGDAGTASNGISLTSGSVSAGLGYCTPDRVIGFAVNAGSTNWRMGSSLGTGDATSFQGGLYAIQRYNALYVLGAGTIGTHNATTHRSTAYFNEALEGSTKAQSYAARIEAGHRFALGAFGLTPYAGASWQTINVQGYNETSVSSAGGALGFAGRNATTRRSEVGVEGDTRIPGTAALLYARLAWVHDFDRSRQADASFVGLPGSNFIVRGARPDSNTAMARAGIAVRLTGDAMLRAEVAGDFFGNVSSVSGTARLNLAF